MKNENSLIFVPYLRIRKGLLLSFSKFRQYGAETFTCLFEGKNEIAYFRSTLDENRAVAHSLRGRKKVFTFCLDFKNNGKIITPASFNEYDIYHVSSPREVITTHLSRLGITAVHNFSSLEEAALNFQFLMENACCKEEPHIIEARY